MSSHQGLLGYRRVRAAAQPPARGGTANLRTDGTISVVSRASLLVLLGADPLTAQRTWLAALALAIPGTTATRWLLLADAGCLVALALAVARPVIAIPAALVVGFAALNVLGMILTDFYLGLAVFHLAVGLTTLLTLRRWRWLGAASLMLAIGLGVLT